MSIMQFLAASEKIDPGSIGITAPVKNADSAVAGILTTVYIWAGIVCVLVIIVAGYLYVTSVADASQIKRAKDAILYAVVGLVVIIMAFVITQAIIGRF